MPVLNLKANTPTQQLVKDYLEKSASATLADKINHGVKIQKDGKTVINKKDMDGFMRFAFEQAKKQANKSKQNRQQQIVVEISKKQASKVRYIMRTARYISPRKPALRAVLPPSFLLFRPRRSLSRKCPYLSLWNSKTKFPKQIPKPNRYPKQRKLYQKFPGQLPHFYPKKKYLPPLPPYSRKARPYINGI